MCANAKPSTLAIGPFWLTLTNSNSLARSNVHVRKNAVHAPPRLMACHVRIVAIGVTAQLKPAGRLMHAAEHARQCGCRACRSATVPACVPS